MCTRSPTSLWTRRRRARAAAARGRRGGRAGRPGRARRVRGRRAPPRRLRGVLAVRQCWRPRPSGPSRIRLTSAVSVLSSDDPVRVFQQFATLDLLSGGRAEIMAGRGSFTESFPLFGYDLADYDDLFAEKLDLLLARTRAGAGHLVGRGTAPRSSTSRCTRGRCRIRCRCGWPSAATRSRWSGPGSLGLPLALAIIGGMPERFAPLAELYRRALAAGEGPRARRHRREPQRARLRRRHPRTRCRRLLPRALRRDEPHRPRARLGPDEPRGFDAQTALRGAYAVGDPAAVAEKILF